MGFVVLSLFDGISCGRVALERAGIDVTSYYASEIERASIAISQANYPDIVEIGDIAKVSYADGTLHTENGDFFIGHVDLLIGGSPCTDFSSIGYTNGMTSGKEEILSLRQYMRLKSKGVKFDGQSYLFWEYVRLMHEVSPDYFLLENVVMSKKWQKTIDSAMGRSPIPINSSLLSAQNRPRLYWTNIPDVGEPADRHVTLGDVLDPGAPATDVSHCKTVQRSLPKFVAKYGYVPTLFNAYNVTELSDKACALSRGSMVTSSCATLLFVRHEDVVHTVRDGLLDGGYPTPLKNGRYNLRKLSFKEMERLQTLPDGYTDVKAAGRHKRSAAIGNGWTVDVISHIFSHIKEAR